MEDLFPDEAVRAFPPFDSMRGSQAGELLQIARPLVLRKGKALYYQGDRALVAYLLVAGTLRGVMYRSDESTIETGRSMPGEWVGLAEVLLDTPRLNDEIADEGCRILAFSRPALDRMLGDANLTHFFLREMARRYYVLHSRIGLITPMERLVRYLASPPGRRGTEEGCRDEIPAEGGRESNRVRQTQEEIAAAIGVTRETVNKYLRLLQQQGLISVGRAEILILDQEGLENAALS